MRSPEVEGRPDRFDDAGTVSRRAVLGLGAAGLIAVGTGVAGKLLGGRSALRKILGKCGPPGDRPPPSSWTIQTRRFDSVFIDGGAGYAIARPPSSAGPLPVCFCFHPKGSSSEWISSFQLQDFVAASIARGNPPFGIAAMDGGNAYWHSRADGTDPMSAFIREFVPICAEKFDLGSDGTRRATIGWSMGGYGALLAAATAPEMFSAVVAVSPALWTSFEEQHRASPAAFDDADDFEENNVFAKAHLLAKMPVRIDCGEADPFAPAVRKFISILSTQPAGGFSEGCHDADYWRRVAPAQVRFLARHLNTPGLKM